MAQPEPSLTDEVRALTRARIVRGAMAMVAEHGLDVTAEQIAQAAGVSRRTVFRHFPTHGAVLGAAVEQIISTYEENLPGPPSADVSLDDWVSSIALHFHDLNRRLIGRAFWDIHVLSTSTAPEIRDALGDLQALRFRYATVVAGHAWKRAAGSSRAPQWVVATFALQLSNFASAAMGDTPLQEVADTSARVLLAVLAAACLERGRR